MTHAEDTCQYAPPRLEDAISVTACTERSDTLRIMTQADNTCRYATRLEDAISVTACTERSGACGWHMQIRPTRQEDAISVTACTELSDTMRIMIKC
jgi:hypothetical protein